MKLQLPAEYVTVIVPYWKFVLIVNSNVCMSLWTTNLFRAMQLSNLLTYLFPTHSFSTPENIREP